MYLPVLALAATSTLGDDRLTSCSRPLEADPPTVSAFVDDHAALIGNYTPALGEDFLADGFADTSGSINALAGPAIADGHAAVTFASKRAFMRSQAARPGSPLAFSPSLPAHAIRWRPGGRRRFGPEGLLVAGISILSFACEGGPLKAGDAVHRVQQHRLLAEHRREPHLFLSCWCCLLFCFGSAFIPGAKGRDRRSRSCFRGGETTATPRAAAQEPPSVRDATTLCFLAVNVADTKEEGADLGLGAVFASVGSRGSNRSARIDAVISVSHGMLPSFLIEGHVGYSWSCMLTYVPAPLGPAATGLRNLKAARRLCCWWKLAATSGSDQT